MTVHRNSALPTFPLCLMAYPLEVRHFEALRNSNVSLILSILSKVSKALANLGNFFEAKRARLRINKSALKRTEIRANPRAAAAVLN